MSTEKLLKGLIDRLVGEADAVKYTIQTAIKQGLQMTGGDEKEFHKKLREIDKIARTL